MNLSVNMLIEWLDQHGVRDERILWISSSGQDVVTIDVGDESALPRFWKYDEVVTSIGANEACILTVDRSARHFPPEDEIPAKHRQRRDEAWAVIKTLVEDNRDEIFIPSRRGDLIDAVVRDTGHTKMTIYKWLRRYWQGGLVKDALLPQYERCGGEGKDHQNSGRKRGRPSALARATGQSTGINVGAYAREKIRRGIRLFYETREERSLRQAYQRTLETFFRLGTEVQDGVAVPILPPADELPSFSQFRYWYYKEYSPSRVTKARKGEREFNVNHRALLGDATRIAFGPGHVYQLDSTPGDTYLVSSLDRSQVIGCPTIYTIKDVFTRLIVGFDVSSEEASWLAAILAFENATADKVAFCAEHGITITESEWPSHHLPEILLADRGEWEGYNADHVVNALGVRVDNTPPYRPELKAIVEQDFNMANQELIHNLPGAKSKPRKRGDKNVCLEACLTLEEFRKLMILRILKHNNHHRYNDYPMDKEMIADHVEPYPVDLWHWGIQNRTGHLRTMPQDAIHLHLLPREKASVTPHGIKFKGLYYVCNLALREEWFERARERGQWSVSVVWDPRRVDTIYLPPEAGRQIEACWLTDKSRTFKACDWEDVIDYFELKKQREEAARTRQYQSEAKYNAQVEAIVKPAREEAQEARKGHSERSIIQGMLGNQKREREIERRREAWDLASGETSGRATQETVPYIPPPEYIDELERHLEEEEADEQL